MMHITPFIVGSDEPMSRSTATREAIVATAYSNLNTWYTWGGNTPESFDCSGLAIACFKAGGLLPRGYDGTAHDLWELFSSSVCTNPQAGCLVFYFDDSDKAKHVTVAVDEFFCIGAEGGGRNVKTLAAAIKANAWIKLRPIDARSQGRRYVDAC